MIGWGAAHSFNGCRFTLSKQCGKSGIPIHSTAEFLDELMGGGRVLALVGEAPEGILDSEGKLADSSPSEMLGKSLINLLSIIPALIVSRGYCGYASVFSCYTPPDDPELDLLRREGIDAIDQASAVDMIRAAGEDPSLVEEALDLSYAEAYINTVDWIGKCVVLGLSGVDLNQRRSFGARPSSAPLVDFKDAEPLLFGLVERPVLRKEWSLADLGTDAARLNMVAMAHPEHRARERKILQALQEAWTDVSRHLEDVFWKRFPDKPREDSVSADEVIAAMCLEHAKEALAAGVPIEDVIC